MKKIINLLILLTLLSCNKMNLQLEQELNNESIFYVKNSISLQDSNLGKSMKVETSFIIEFKEIIKEVNSNSYKTDLYISDLKIDLSQNLTNYDELKELNIEEINQNLNKEIANVLADAKEQALEIRYSNYGEVLDFKFFNNLALLTNEHENIYQTIISEIIDEKSLKQILEKRYEFLPPNKIKNSWTKNQISNLFYPISIKFKYQIIEKNKDFIVIETKNKSKLEKSLNYEGEITSSAIIKISRKTNTLLHADYSSDIDGFTKINVGVNVFQIPLKMQSREIYSLDKFEFY